MTRLARQAGELLKLTVRDDGKGFDPDRVAVGHLGVVGMRHRAEQLGGTLAIRSEPDRGSTVELRVPFQGGSAREP